MTKILVAVDGSPESDKALDYAADLAKANKAELVVVNVAEDFCPAGVTEIDCKVVRELAMKGAKATLAAALERVKPKGISTRGVIESGRPADVVDGIAQREKVDQVVVGSRGKHGARKLALGTVSGRIAEWSPVTVTIVR